MPLEGRVVTTELVLTRWPNVRNDMSAPISSPIAIRAMPITAMAEITNAISVQNNKHPMRFQQNVYVKDAAIFHVEYCHTNTKHSIEDSIINHENCHSRFNRQLTRLRQAIML